MTNRRGTNIQGRLLLHLTRNKAKLVNLPDIMEALGETDTKRVLSALSRLKARTELGNLEIVVRGTTYRFYPAPQPPEGDKPPVPNTARAIAAGQTELVGKDHGPAFDSDIPPAARRREGETVGEYARRITGADEPSLEQRRAKELFDRHVTQGPIEDDAPTCAHGDPECDCLTRDQGGYPPAHTRTDDPEPRRMGAFTSERPSGAFATQERLFQEVGTAKDGRPMLRCEDGTFWKAEQI